MNTQPPDPNEHHPREDDRPTIPPPASSSDPTNLGQLFERREAPQRIGPYRVIHQVGHGGMGLVFLAIRDDDQFHKRVALKVVKRGMDTDDILRRFEMERQLLAAMNHPNIARLIDGGETEDGRPYFAMEYVEGKPIDEYCDDNRLPIAERLKLFQQVCQGVHYAHTNLVVHRDLKPGNILVTKEGVPKLLDFGIAKLLNPEIAIFQHDPTGTAMRLMTPEYASPEQVRGDALTTASDVYALGVLLYELLTGHPPYRLKSRIESEIRHVICDVDPERPSTAVSKVEEVPADYPTEPGKPTTRTIGPGEVAKVRELRPDRLRRRLAGDIDNIVMMALRKEPRKRYTSAEQFAEDIERHLDGMPVIARSPTLGYRFGKFVNRNKAGVGAAAAVVAALAIGLVATLLMASEARKQERIAIEQRDVADRERQRAEGLVGSMENMSAAFLPRLIDQLRNLAGATAARELLVKTAMEFYDELIRSAGDDPSMRRYKALLLERRGDVLGSMRANNTGEGAESLKSYREAFELRKAIADEDPKNVDVQRQLASSQVRVADGIAASGDYRGALTEYQQALTVLTKLSGTNAADVQIRRAMAGALLSQGDMYEKLNDIDLALTSYTESQKLREGLAAIVSDDPVAKREVAVGATRLADILRKQGRAKDALEPCLRVVKIREELLATKPDNGQYRRDMLWGYYWLGQTQVALEDIDAAQASFARANELADGLFADDPVNARARFDSCVMRQALGDLAERRSKWADAGTKYTEAIDLLTPMIKPDTKNRVWRQTFGMLHRSLGQVMHKQGQAAPGREKVEQSLEVFKSLRADNPGDPEIQALIRDTETMLADWGKTAATQ